MLLVQKPAFGDTLLSRVAFPTMARFRQSQLPLAAACLLQPAPSPFHSAISELYREGQTLQLSQPRSVNYGNNASTCLLLCIA